MTRCFWCKT